MPEPSYIFKWRNPRVSGRCSLLSSVKFHQSRARVHQVGAHDRNRTTDYCVSITFNCRLCRVDNKCFSWLTLCKLFNPFPAKHWLLRLRITSVNRLSPTRLKAARHFAKTRSLRGLMSVGFLCARHCCNSRRRVLLRSCLTRVLSPPQFQWKRSRSYSR